MRRINKSYSNLVKILMSLKEQLHELLLANGIEIKEACCKVNRKVVIPLQYRRP